MIMNSLIVPCGILRTVPLATCAAARILCHFFEAEMLDLKSQHCIIKTIKITLKTNLGCVVGTTHCVSLQCLHSGSHELKIHWYLLFSIILKTKRPLTSSKRANYLRLISSASSLASSWKSSESLPDLVNKSFEGL